MAFSVVQTCRRRFVSGVQPRGRTVVMRAASFRANTINLNTFEPTKVTPLSNGVRLVTEPAQSNLASFSVSVDAGVAHEQPGLNGVANLLQTAAVKSRAAEAQRWGAKLTGRTTRGGTTYTISCLPEDASHAVALLGQLVSSPVPADSVEAARSEIIEERRALWDVVNEDVVFDFLYSAAYQQTPLQQSVAGEIADLKKATLDDVQAFKSQNYAGSNVVVAASGAFDQAQIQPLVESSFGKLPQASTSVRRERVPYTGSFMHIRDDTVPEIQVAIGFETFPANHKHSFTLGVLQQLIGEWHTHSLAGSYASSRLAEGFALQKLVDRYHTFNHQHRNTGLFGVYLNLNDGDKLDDAVYHTFNEFQKLLTYISPEELFRAKNALKNKILAAEDSVASRSRHIAEQVLTVDRRVSVPEAFSRINDVNEKDVHDVLDHYFYDVDPVVVAHGPIEEMPDYVVMRNWTYWNRW